MAKKIDNKEIKSNKKAKSKSMRKIFLLIIPVIIIVCIIGFMWFTQTTDVVNAQLIVESGTVQVKHAGGSWTSAQNSMLLHQSDSVKTGDNTSASIILFESSIIRLDSNTEVTIQELIQQEEETSVEIKQDYGRTWNTISKMSGIDNYEVHTPTTVASVRGTSFDVYILADGNIIISVGNGTVNVTTYENGQIMSSIEVPENLSVSVDPDNLNETPEPQPYVKDEWILGNQQKDDEFKGSLKEELYKRIEPFLPELKEQYGLTDQELEALIDGYVMGYFDLPSDSPEWARKLFELT